MEPPTEPIQPAPSPPAPSGPLSGTGPAAARVYAHVKERLLDGSFPGGALLSENELSQQLGLSRTPVRQAFVQLEAEGLLELYPKRGALVVPVAASEIEDVFEARLLVEEHCARRAAAAGGAELPAPLPPPVAPPRRAAPSSPPSSPPRSPPRSARSPRAGADGRSSRSPTASSTGRSSTPRATRSSRVCTTRCATASSASRRSRSPATRETPNASSPSIAESPTR